MRDETAEAMLHSGSEIPVILAARAQRVAWVLALVAFVALLVVRSRPEWSGARGPLGIALVALVVAAFLLKLLVPWLDRRAMEKDVALVERLESERR